MKYIPISLPVFPIKNAMEFWYYWNIRGDEISHMIYRVEDMDNVFEKICEFIGVEPNWNALHSISRRNHVWGRKHNTDYKWLKWEDLEKTDTELCKKIRLLGRKYGYLDEDLYD